MAFKSFYRTYRPQVFDDVVGQEHIVTTLKNALRTNRVSHAYLFCGPRGTGKTTLAKILAKAVNCMDEHNAPCGYCEHCTEIGAGTFPDVIEIDAASNNGVDEIRDLIDKVKYAPLEGKMKVYIIDEVHMLSQGAFNALLKTLEEPPEHVIFVLATTEAHKVLPTIVSRCQRFDFKRISLDDLTKHLEGILKNEEIEYEEGVCQLIASLSDGGARDALTLLEQCVTYSTDIIRVSDVYEMNGVTTPEERYDLLVAIQKGDMKDVYEKTRLLMSKNIDVQRLMNDLIELLKDASIYNFSKNEKYVKPLDLDVVKKISQSMRVSQLLELTDILVDTIDKARFTNNISSYFELALIKMVELDHEIEPIEFIEKTVVKKEEESKKRIEPKKEEKEPEKEVKENKEIPLSEAVSEEVKKEPKKHSEEEVTETTIWNPGDIVTYMMAANKEEKFNDQESFQNLEMISMDSKWTQLCNFLKNAQVVLSGEAFAFVAVDYQSRATQINEVSIKMIDLSESLFGKRKYIYAITHDVFNQSIDLYKKLASEKALPQPKEIQVPNLEVLKDSSPKQNDIPEGIFELFGDDIDIE